MLSKHLSSRLRAIDWDFAGASSESAFSNVHWHPARFVSQIPATFVGLLSEAGGLVLDPFGGSGTTVVEAQRLGRRGLGIDLHPVSCLVTRAKTLTCSARQVGIHIRRLREDARGALAGQRMLKGPVREAAVVPRGVQGRKWYVNEVLGDLGELWGLVRSYRGARRTIAEAMFSAILLPVCRETRHWGYVCDNSSPRGDVGREVLGEYVKALARLEKAYRLRERDAVGRFGADGRLPSVRVVCDDARTALKRLGRGVADLVVTSPPYFGVADYVKAQRLSMEWFGWDIEALRRRELGARSKRHRKAAATEYLGELGETCELVRSRLRPGAVAVFVIGESRARGSVMKQVKETLVDVGFGLEMDMNRVVSAQRRQAPSVGGEHLLVCVAR